MPFWINGTVDDALLLTYRQCEEHPRSRPDQEITANSRFCFLATVTVRVSRLEFS